MLRQPTHTPRLALAAFPRALLVGAVAFLACLLAGLLSLGTPAGLVVWPAAGVAVAVGWRFGLHWALPAALGAAAWVLAREFSLMLAFAAFCATSIGPLLAIAAARRLSVWKPTDHRLDSVVRFLVAACLITAPIDALVATLLLDLAGALPTTSEQSLFLAWWIIDALGILLIAPVILACIDGRGGDDDPGSAAPWLFDPVAILLTLAVCGASLALDEQAADSYSWALLLLYFPIVAWVASRLPERATVFTLLVTALAMLAVRGYHSGAGNDADGAAFALQGSMAVLFAVMLGLLMQALAADRRLVLARLAQQSRQDPTTGLLNDRGLLGELATRLVAPDRPNYGLVGIQIANFDTIHDLCGPIQALQLETGIAQMLAAHQDGAKAARIASGRFALLAPADTVAQVRSLARELYSQLNGQVFKAEHGSIRLLASVGGLLLDRNVMIDAEDCLLSLSDAMAIAGSVRDPQLFVEPLSQSMIDVRRAHQGKVEHIREAIHEHRLEVHAQPIVEPDAQDGMISYEILTRLRDRAGKLIRPPEFLPLAMQSQMTVALDRAVIQMVFAWLAAHPDELARTRKCSINLSGMTMSDSAITTYIREQRALNAIPAEKIVFEITESEAIRNPAAASRLVDDLKADGFGIALDDFGTGLATFEYLKRFPLDYLKIDGSFIRNLMSNPIDEEIVLSTVRVARRLNVRTIAEHVHNRQIYDRLRALGVEFVQGELLGAPVPIDSLFSRRAEGTRENERA